MTETEKKILSNKYCEATGNHLFPDLLLVLLVIFGSTKKHHISSHKFNDIIGKVEVL